MSDAKGTYIGQVDFLRNQTALVRHDDGPCDHKGRFTVLAQFDDVGLELHGKQLGFGWHRFFRHEFSVPEWADPEDMGAPQHNI